MSQTTLDRIVAATLYEGYILYPYRPSSVKNQVRWTFGGVHPRSWSEATGGSDPWLAQTECLIRAADATSITVRVRFLQLVTRTVARLEPPAEIARRRCDGAARGCGRVARGRASTIARGMRRPRSTIDCGTHALSAVLEREVVVEHAIPGRDEIEPLLDEQRPDRRCAAT